MGNGWEKVGVPKVGVLLEGGDPAMPATMNTGIGRMPHSFHLATVEVALHATFCSGPDLQARIIQDTSRDVRLA